jgi:hypothetical protein
MRSPELSEHELRARLRGVAAQHQPDRAAMLHRIARYRPELPVAERRPAAQAWRLAGSALAVATIVGVGGVAQWALADGPEPDAPPAGPGSTSPTPPAASATAVPAPAATATSRPPTGTKASAGLPSSPAASRDASRPPAKEASADRQPLWADGSINPNSDDTEGRSDITVKVREPVRALEVTVRVAMTAGLTDQGSTHDATGAPIGTTVVHERDALVYHFRLAGGATLGAGTYVFTAKYAYDNEGGRDAGADTYRVTATTDESTELKLSGDFY